MVSNNQDWNIDLSTLNFLTTLCAFSIETNSFYFFFSTPNALTWTMKQNNDPTKTADPSL